MAIVKQSEVHRRRWGRNIGLGLVLGGFVVLVFAVSMVKFSEGDPLAGLRGQVPGAEADR